MAEIKSFAVGFGDMFYINHGTDNFTVIDIHLNNDENKKRILKEIMEKVSINDVFRFISTHPDEDHIKGLIELDKENPILNFYCVENEATKSESESEDFKKYKELRDSPKKAFYIYKGCSRKWMNESDEKRGSSGLSILWPDPLNEHFIEVLESVKNGGNSNNLSPVIRYSLNNGVSAVWFGDLEKDFMEKISDNIEFKETDIVFAPHHGRKSGKLSKDILRILNPQLIVIGEAPSEHIDYYLKRKEDYDKGVEYYKDLSYNTITQNSAGDILFKSGTNETDVYVSNENYKKELNGVRYKTDYDLIDEMYYFCTIDH